MNFSKHRPLHSRRRQSQCVLCLHVHRIVGLPSAMNGRVLVVGWRTKDCEGETTLPVEACGGTAGFDEIFLHYCSAERVRSVLESVIVSVLLVDDAVAAAADRSVGVFRNDLSEMVLVGGLSTTKFVGRTLNFDLEGIATGGALSVGVFYKTMMELEETNHPNYTSSCHKQNKHSRFSCLPHLKCLRGRRRRPRSPSVERVRRILSEPIKSATTDHYPLPLSLPLPLPLEDEDSGFITIEREAVRSHSRRLPSNDLTNTDDDDGDYYEFVESDDEKPCLLTELDDDVEKVADEFLRELEEKYWGAMDLTPGGADDVELDCLIKEAEVELRKASQVLKSSRAGGGAALENEEYEELMKRWGSNGTSSPPPSSSSSSSSSSSCCYVVCGFGSPIYN